MFNLEMAQDLFNKLYEHRNNGSGINVPGLYKTMYKEGYGDTVRHFKEKNFMQEHRSYTKATPGEIRFEMTHEGIRHFEKSLGVFKYDPDMPML